MQKQKIKFLSHIVSADDIQTDKDKMSAVERYPVPTSVKSLRSWMSLCQYYRKFCKDFSKYAAPLNALLKKDVPIIWTNECQSSFEHIKQTLITVLMLNYPNLNKPFKLFEKGTYLHKKLKIINFLFFTLSSTTFYSASDGVILF